MAGSSAKNHASTTRYAKAPTTNSSTLRIQRIPRASPSPVLPLVLLRRASIAPFSHRRRPDTAGRLLLFIGQRREVVPEALLGLVDGDLPVLALVRPLDELVEAILRSLGPLLGRSCHSTAY